MTNHRFKDYIQFLREHFGDLVEYREIAGGSEMKLTQVQEDLFNEDPMVVFGATLVATAAFSDKSLYH